MGVRVTENRPSFKRKRDNYARKLRRKKLINYLQNQLLSCTTHGLPYIVNTKIHWLGRLFWAISFLISTCIIIFLLSTQYNRYKNRPIVTSVEMDYFNWNVSFPAITLCPMYKIEDDDLASIINDTMESSDENLGTQLRAICSLSMDTIEVYDFNAIDISPTFHPGDHAMLASIIFKKFDNNSLTTSTNWPVSVEMAMTELGMCHVINSNVASYDNPTKWGIDLQYNALKNNIELSVHEQEFFIQLINYADSYKVFIHSPDDIILSTTPSYMSSTKNFAHFGVQVWSTRISSKLRTFPINLRNCRFIDEPISKRYPVYSYNHCILECRIQMILKICGCIPHLYRNLADESVCSLLQLECFVQFKREFLKLSVSDAMLANYTGLDDLPRSSRDCGCVNSCESDIFLKDHETFMSGLENDRLRVSISSYPKVRVVKDTIFNIYDIILRSGGVVNLCVGASIISMMELILLFTKITIYILLSYISRILKKIKGWLLSNCYKGVKNTKKQ